MTITRDDWLRALHEAQEASMPEVTDALTVRELADLFQCSLSVAKRRIDLLVASGRAEETTKTLRMRNGGRRTAAAYRLLMEVSDAVPAGHSR